ncbi:hypothetical protein [Flavivirga rizhaonensis]|uniref:C1q domain-containing protein n=1 Tax=Flavivirga rizhaonensis TaxID=2559571 RepID=A0A4S1DUU4_9FLAO|nr:hypothetical protein [Flavivirga rizhaonensis]TGV01192.1 hypothetical protein EM932_16260 [Flavivirga rizhaonensis]
MKKIAYSIMLLFCTHYYVHAQVGIGTTSPNTSSILDVESTDKGILIPRLDTGAINAIASPANGLLVFNTDLNEFQFNFGTSASPNWSKISHSISLKYSNTDTTTNINTAAYTNIPIFGSVDWNDHLASCNVTGNTVTLNTSGRYRIVVNISYIVPTISGNSDVRVAVEAQIAINGTPTGTIAATGYVRHNSGHTEASLHISEVLNITNGDIISVQTIQSGNSAPAVLRSAGTSNIFIEKIK